MRLQYIPQPVNGNNAGVAFSKFGETISSLGQLGADENKRKRDDAFANEKMNLAKTANQRADKQVNLQEIETKKRIEKLDFDLKTANDTNVSKEKRDAATVSVFRTLHPKATASFNDEEVKVYAAEIDKFLPKGEKISKLDTRVTPAGDKILTYTSNGDIHEKNMGKVKTDWNGKNASSDIPEGSVSVGKDFYEKHADKGMVKISKGGKFYAPISFVNQKSKEYIKGQYDVGNMKLE